MKLNQLIACPFCLKKPTQHEDVGPTGFVFSKEDDLIYFVACMTKDCPPSGVYFTDISWNIVAAKQSTLMKAVFSNLEENESPELEEKKRRYSLYVE